VTQTATKQQPEAPQPFAGEASLPEMPLEELQAEQLRLLWGRRRFFFRAVAAGLIVSGLGLARGARATA